MDTAIREAPFPGSHESADPADRFGNRGLGIQADCP